MKNIKYKNIKNYEIQEKQNILRSSARPNHGKFKFILTFVFLGKLTELKSEFNILFCTIILIVPSKLFGLLQKDVVTAV